LAARIFGRFPGQQDVLRYALTSNPETKDNDDFTWKDFQARNNNELVAIYGNFINRVVVLTINITTELFLARTHYQK
jgi:methionyl-tRNA synthetase